MLASGMSFEICVELVLAVGTCRAVRARCSWKEVAAKSHLLRSKVGDRGRAGDGRDTSGKVDVKFAPFASFRSR